MSIRRMRPWDRQPRPLAGVAVHRGDTRRNNDVYFCIPRRHIIEWVAEASVTKARSQSSGPRLVRAPRLADQLAWLRRGVVVAEASRTLGAPLVCDEVVRTALGLAVPLLADAGAGWLVE